MADGVNRVVPHSGSLDRTPELGRQRERKNNKGNERKRTEEGRRELPAAPAPVEDDLTEPEKNKGKNLDIKA